MSTTKPLVWFKYNLWQLAWNPAYNFTATKGINFAGLHGLASQPSPSNPNPNFFSTVKYKGLDFVKYYQYDAGRNVVNAERITPRSYVSIAAWAFQGLRIEDRQKQIPIALPAIDARLVMRLKTLTAGGLSGRPTRARVPSCLRRPR